MLRPHHLDVPGSTLVPYVLLDVVLIVALARLLGNLVARFGQPRVVGEILAGLLLGPTVLGSDLSARIAPVEARPALAALATLGLILFMFLAGVEFDASVLHGRMWRQAGSLAFLSVGIPAALGIPVAAAMHDPTYAGPGGGSFLGFALFVGAALAVTAFPVMAHILMERGELNTRMGSLGVATAGIMSILMFTYLGVAAAIASSDYGHLLVNLALLAAFLLGSAVVVRPLLERLFHPVAGGGSISGGAMAIVFSGMVLYALITDRIGIHALVGGFVWGVLLPADGAFRRAVATRVHDVATVFLLPVFFALAGLSADLRLITLGTAPVLLLVLVAAIGGKFLAAAAARGMGLSWREAGVIGALTNTRGLLVLVAGLIGLNLGIFTATSFTILVVVALVTNLMTLPLLRRLSGPAAAPTPIEDAAVEAATAAEAARAEAR